MIKLSGDGWFVVPDIMNTAAYNATWFASEFDGTFAYRLTTHTPLGITAKVDTSIAVLKKRLAGIILLSLPYVALTEIGPTVRTLALIGTLESKYESVISWFVGESPSGLSHKIVPLDP